MKITVFTPTYNRGYILHNLYTSLIKQNFNDFEWIIVDDGSTDNTKDLLVKWINENKIDIKVYFQNRGGKHRAINYAVKKAKGDFFFIVDSDDMLTDDALTIVSKWIDMIYQSEQIAGVAGLRINQTGKVLGGVPKYADDCNSWIDATNFERKKFGLLGDKAEVYRTSILKKFPFPEFENELFITEDICWDQIAYAGYKIRWFNKPIYICEYLDDGLTKNGANDMEGYISNFNGHTQYVKNHIFFTGITNNLRMIYTYLKVCKIKHINIIQGLHNINISLIRFSVLLIQIPFILFKKRVFRK